MSTHGGIDGYSRLITFLKVDVDNRASTVFNECVGACIQTRHSITSAVRSWGRERNDCTLHELDEWRGKEKPHYWTLCP